MIQQYIDFLNSTLVRLTLYHTFGIKVGLLTDDCIKKHICKIQSLLGELNTLDEDVFDDTIYYQEIRYYLDEVFYNINLTNIKSVNFYTYPLTNIVVSNILYNSVTLTWEYLQKSGTRYILEKSVDGISYIEIATLIVKTYTDNTLSHNTPYYYRIRVIEGDIASDYSYATIRTLHVVPIGLQTTVLTEEQINLSWIDNNFGETGYLIQISEDDLSWTDVTTTAGNINNYIISSLNDGTKYYFRIKTVNSLYNNDSAFTTSVNNTTNLYKPTILTIENLTSNEVYLSWYDNSSNETNFILEYSNDFTTWNILDNTIPNNTTTYYINTLSQGTQYYFRIKAENSILGVESLYSNIVNGITTLAAPSSLVGTVISDTEIDLTWVNNSDGFETEIEIYRSLDNITFGLLDTVVTGTTSYNDTGLSVDTTYYYKIRAINLLVNSSYSSTINKKTLFAFSFLSKATAAATFVVSITYGGADTPKWVMPDGDIITNASVSGIGSTFGFDSTSKLVKLLILDKTSITAFIGTSTTKCDGVMNFSVFVGATFSNITLNTTDSGTCTELDCRVINYSDNFTISAVNHDISSFLINTSSTAIVSSINVSGNNIAVFDRGGLRYEGSTLTGSALDFSYNLLEEFELTVNDIFSYLDLSNNEITSLPHLENVDFTGLSSRLYLSENPLMIPVLPSSITGKFQHLYLTNTGMVGTVDLDAYDYYTLSEIACEGNTLVDEIIYPVMATGSIKTLHIGNNNLSGIQDFSGIIGHTLVAFRCSVNSGLTGFTPFANEASISRSTFQARTCNLTGSIDMSMYTFGAMSTGGQFQFNENPLLTGLILSDFTTTRIGIDISNCGLTDLDIDLCGIGAFDMNNSSVSLNDNGMSAGIVNKILVDCVAIYSSGFTGREINIGGSNASPDTTSGGYNGTAARTTLQGYGITVNI